MRRQLAIAAFLLLSTSILAQSPSTAPVVEGPVFHDGPRLLLEDLLIGAARYEAEIRRRTAELEGLQERLVARANQVRDEFVAVEMPRANQALESAKASLKDANERVTALLEKDQAYLAAVQRRDAARAHVAELREKGSASSTLASAASEAMAAASAVAQIEAKAQRMDPQVAEARARLTKAENAVARLTRAQKAVTRLDPEIKAAVLADREAKELLDAIEDSYADINAAYSDLSLIESREQARERWRDGQMYWKQFWDKQPALPNLTKADYDRMARTGSGGVAYMDTRYITLEYLGFALITGSTPDPHVPIQRPAPYGQSPPREPPIWIWDLWGAKPPTVIRR